MSDVCKDHSESVSIIRDAFQDLFDDKQCLEELHEHFSQGIEEAAARCMPRDRAQAFAIRSGEVFNTLIQKNVEDTANNHVTSASEEEDEKKEEIVNENLLPELGELIVNLSKKRKTYPNCCSKALHQKLKQRKKNIEHVESHVIQTKLNISPLNVTIVDGMQKKEDLLYAKVLMEPAFRHLNEFNKCVQGQIDSIATMYEDAQLIKNVLLSYGNNELDSNSTLGVTYSSSPLVLSPMLLVRK